MKVWDAAVRILHWALVAGVVAAWVTSERGVRWHDAAGYAVLAVVGARGLWGLVGGRYARFRQFVRGPRQTLTYARLLLARAEPRYVGHNPLGGWMVVALLACVAGVALTGWLFTTDRFWGNELVEACHRSLAWLLLGLIALHVGGVAYTSWRHRESLVGAMWTGRKRAPGEGEVS